MVELNFQKWLMNNRPSEEMIYERAFFDTYVFWREKILEMFTDEFYKKNRNYNRVYKEINKNVEVVGTHMSKSIVHPVLRIVYHGVTIVVRYNFYDYEIAVISDKPIYIPMEKLFYSKTGNFFYQGFPEEYIIKDKYEDNKCKFIAGLDNHYQFYTFMYLLQRQIYFNSKEKKKNGTV